MEEEEFIKPVYHINDVFCMCDECYEYKQKIITEEIDKEILDDLRKHMKEKENKNGRTRTTD